MQTPVEIDFQGMPLTEALRQSIAGHVAELETRSGRITSARVVLKAPGSHHQTGGQFEVNIHLALPNGRKVIVSHTPKADERHADIDFAINDAFKRARRQLQDQVRELQSQTKTHAEPSIGSVTTLKDDFGFLEAANDGHEVYFHRNSVLNDGFARLKIGTRVTFAEEMGEKGAQASTVKLLGKHGLL